MRSNSQPPVFPGIADSSRIDGEDYRLSRWAATMFRTMSLDRPLHAPQLCQLLDRRLHLIPKVLLKRSSAGQWKHLAEGVVRERGLSVNNESQIVHLLVVSKPLKLRDRRQSTPGALKIIPQESSSFLARADLSELRLLRFDVTHFADDLSQLTQSLFAAKGFLLCTSLRFLRANHCFLREKRSFLCFFSRNPLQIPPSNGQSSLLTRSLHFIAERCALLPHLIGRIRRVV
jgi:hypothetical protein